MKHVRAETSALNSAQFFFTPETKVILAPHTKPCPLMGWYVTVPGFTSDFPGDQIFNSSLPATANQTRTQNTKREPRSMAAATIGGAASSTPKLSLSFSPPRAIAFFPHRFPRRASRADAGRVRSAMRSRRDTSPSPRGLRVFPWWRRPATRSWSGCDRDVVSAPPAPCAAAPGPLRQPASTNHTKPARTER